MNIQSHTAERSGSEGEKNLVREARQVIPVKDISASLAQFHIRFVHLSKKMIPHIFKK
jgi:hypothetical protein